MANHLNDIMDEAVRVISSRTAARDRLATRLSKHVGTFDCSDMDEAAVARYGCQKIGLRVPAGHERTALNVYLHTHKAPSEQATTRGTAMDSRPGKWLDKQAAELRA